MKRILSIALAVMTILLGTHVSRAEPMLFFSTTARDLNNLTVGQSISFDVNLSGINGPTDNLDLLAATVTFDGELLGTPSIHPGSIVPDQTGFLSAAMPGLADAN